MTLVYVQCFAFADTLDISVKRKQIDNSITLQFKEYSNHACVELVLDLSSIPENCKDVVDEWGKLSLNTHSGRMPISSFSKRDLADIIEFDIAILDFQLPLVDAAIEETKAKLAEWEAEEQDKIKKIDQLQYDLDYLINGMEYSHPLTGSEKQVKWANDIRWQTTMNVISEDPDNAEELINRSLNDPARRQAEFWIDNRRALGYR